MSGDAFCVLPWVHVEVVPDGDAKICCVAKEAIREGGRPMNVARHSLEQIRNSEYMRTVRASLASGRKIPVCSYCWRQESRGEGSQREMWNKTFPEATRSLRERIDAGQDVSEPLPLTYLQISVGNQCNLACRMCNASYSSRIAADPVHSRWAPPVGLDQEVVWHDGPAIDPAEPAPVRASFTPGTPWFEQREFIEQDMIGAGASLKVLYVTGGEPLFIPAFDRLLDEYVERGFAQHMTFSLNTNLFHNEAKIARALESLRRFEHCHLAASVDGYEAVYEYVRYPAKWKVIDRNLRTVAQAAREHWRLRFLMTTVAQAYNVFNLPALLRYADGIGVECVPHVVETPLHLRPHVLPQPLRARAAAGLHAFAQEPAPPGAPEANRAHALRIARYLDAIVDDGDTEILQGRFRDFTRALDRSRKQNLADAVPELAELVPARRWWQLPVLSATR